MPTIQQFKSNIAGGGARPNQFRCSLYFPQWVGAIGQSAGQASEFLCIASSIPAVTMTDIALSYRGRPVYVAGERVFPAWSVTILNDTNFLIRNALEIWSNNIVHYNATSGKTRPATYQVPMEVHQLDRNNRTLKSYRFYDAFPTSIGGFGLSFAANQEVETYEVSFAYNYYETTGIGSNGAPLGGGLAESSNTSTAGHIMEEAIEGAVIGGITAGPGGAVAGAVLAGAGAALGIL